MTLMPKPIESFVDFATLLREHGFSISPDQTMDFIAAVGLLGPRTIDDIKASALALFAIPPDQMDMFDALFRAYFLGQVLAPPSQGDDEEDLEVHEPGSETREIETEDDESEPGEIATGTEVLAQRRFASDDNLVSINSFARRAPKELPKRLSYRFASANKGRKLNMRQLLKSAAQTDGDVVSLPWLTRKTRQRKILLLVDVSGSMSDLSDNYMRFAHVLAKSAAQFECFTLGTRLTRITSSLSPKDRGAALNRVSQVVADFDGGTRIGDALGAFLSIPRFAGFARGSLVLVISDGLERGDPTAMIDAVKRLSRMAWQLHWLSPLASDEDFTPSTEALVGILPEVDDLAGARNIEQVTAHVLNIARAA